MTARHTAACRSEHAREDTDLLLHELLERVDRITELAETCVAVAAPLLKGRLAKLAGGRAMAKVEAQWKKADQ
jgi:hypothetical protein